jgi:hypothetical protein
MNLVDPDFTSAVRRWAPRFMEWYGAGLLSPDWLYIENFAAGQDWAEQELMALDVADPEAPGCTDGWLLYDFRGSNPIARSVIGFDESQIGTRRWFYLIPARGEPVAILHVIEPHATRGAPGKTVLYRSWKDLEALLREHLRGFGEWR